MKVLSPAPVKRAAIWVPRVDWVEARLLLFVVLQGREGHPVTSNLLQCNFHIAAIREKKLQHSCFECVSTEAYLELRQALESLP